MSIRASVLAHGHDRLAHALLDLPEDHRPDLLAGLRCHVGPGARADHVQRLAEHGVDLSRMGGHQLLHETVGVEALDQVLGAEDVPGGGGDLGGELRGQPVHDALPLERSHAPGLARVEHHLHRRPVGDVPDERRDQRDGDEQNQCVLHGGGLRGAARCQVLATLSS
ncbi:MAG: hypothetical protein S0880_32820 [Actinomycetota bacterium]|nr:hypothetical protein [Actinomycetota bacterium]